MRNKLNLLRSRNKPDRKNRNNKQSLQNRSRQDLRNSNSKLSHRSKSNKRRAKKRTSRNILNSRPGAKNKTSRSTGSNRPRPNKQQLSTNFPIASDPRLLDLDDPSVMLATRIKTRPHRSANLAKDAQRGYRSYWPARMAAALGSDWRRAIMKGTATRWSSSSSSTSSWTSI